MSTVTVTSTEVMNRHLVLVRWFVFPSLAVAFGLFLLSQCLFGIVTDGPGFDRRQGPCFSHVLSRPAVRFSQPRVELIPGSLSPEQKQLGREADCSPRYCQV